MRNAFVLLVLAATSLPAAVIDVTGSGSTSGLSWSFSGTGFGTHTDAPGGQFPFALVPCAPNTGCAFSFSLSTVGFYSSGSFNGTSSGYFTGSLQATGLLSYTNSSTYSAPLSIQGTITGWSDPAGPNDQRLPLFNATITAQGSAHLFDIIQQTGSPNLVQLDSFSATGTATVSAVPEPGAWWLAAGGLGVLRRKLRRRATRVA